MIKALGKVYLKTAGEFSVGLVQKHLKGFSVGVISTKLVLKKLAAAQVKSGHTRMHGPIMGGQQRATIQCPHYKECLSGLKDTCTANKQNASHLQVSYNDK